MPQEELAILVRLKDFATRGFKSLTGTVTRFSKQSVSAIRKVGSTLVNLKTTLGLAAAGFAAIKTIDFASEVENMQVSFDSLSKSIGEKGVTVLEKLRAGARGTVSDLNLMKSANQAIILGVAKSADELGELTEVARRLGKAVGRDATEAFQDLTTGIGRQSKLILDNLGLIVSVEKANVAYAKSLNKTVAQLTEIERKQAFLNATLEAAREKVKALGPDVLTLGEIVGQLKAEFANIAKELAVTFLPQIKAAVEDFRNFVKTNKPVILNVFADILEGIKNFAASSATAFNTAIAPFLRVEQLNLMRKRFATEAALFRERFQRLGSISAENTERISKEIFRLEGESESLLFRIQAIQANIAGAGNAGVTEMVAGADKVIAKLRQLSREAAEVKTILEFDVSSDSRVQALGAELLDLEGLFKNVGDAASEVATRGSEAFRNLQFAAEDYTLRGLGWIITETNRLKVAEQELEAQRRKAREANNQAVAAAIQSHKEQTVGIEGARAALRQLKEEYESTGVQAANAIIDADRALRGGLVDGLWESIKRTKDLGDAWRDVGRRILDQIGRIITELLVMAAVRKTIGALSGPGGILSAFLSDGGVLPGSTFSPGIQSTRTTATIGEGGRPEAVVPLPDGRSIPVVNVGGGGGGRGVGGGTQITQNIVFNHSFSSPLDERRMLERNKETIVGAVAQANNSSLQAREGLN